ncbi:MAG: EAL domain-containing protein [Desulfobulbaceae bacterium]|nr:EAL domain-containing protein [Desulfobulbaceae bacterium]
MDRVGQSLKKNVDIMKSRVTKYAIYGVLIAILAIIVATLLSSFFQFGKLSLDNFLEAQKSNTTLWVLDAMPFIFAFWGQYVSSIMAYEAGSLVIDQTQELRSQTAALQYQAAHDATHDALTDLPNRVLLRDRLLQAINTAQRDNKKLAFLLLDLDHFKEINDTLGHYNGDRLLKHLALRLQNVMRASDTLARLGGDEFGILLPIIKESDDVQIVAGKIQKSLRSPFVLEGLKLEVQASMGIAIYPEHGKDVDTLMQRADVAMYVAKQDNQQVTVYSTELDKHTPQKLTLVGELRQAIENEELRLHYQPKIDLRSDSIKSVEALVRWQHPQHGFMPPDEFIPLAERTGLIKQLSTWVIKHAFGQAVAWHKKGMKLSVAINLSPSTLLDTDFPDAITGMLAMYNLPPHYITFEITEGSIIKDPERAMEILVRLSEMGIHLSIDDFGTGYSSLAYLKKLPVNELKIDKSFVMDMLENENDAVIVRSTIDLAHNLGLQVVAEGVENKETAAHLKSLGCDILQGYHFSKPLSSEDFDAWFGSQKIPEAKNRISRQSSHHQTVHQGLSYGHK